MKKPKKLRKLIKAAKMGKPPALYRLGLCYYNGHMVAKDEEKGVDLILKSAIERYTPADYWMQDYAFTNEEVLAEGLRLCEEIYNSNMGDNL